MVDNRKSLKSAIDRAVDKRLKSEMSSLKKKISSDILKEVKKSSLYGGGLYGARGKAGLYGAKLR